MTSRRLLMLAVFSVALAACGSETPVATTSSVPSTAASTTVAIETTAAPVAAADTVAPAANTAAPPAGIVAGAVVPEVLCVTDGLSGFAEADVYFAVDNQSDSPVAIADPAANVLNGVGVAGPDVDEPLVPTVFGIGRTSPAFVAVAASESVTWSLTGPDGQTRTATATAESPLCTQDDLVSSIGDDRDFGFEFSVVSSTGTPPTEATVLVAPVDPSTATSRCGAGVEALPARAAFLVNGEYMPVGEPLVVPMDAPFPGSPTAAVSAGAAFVQYVVIDRCAFGGVESQQWPMGPDFDFGWSDLAPALCVTYDGTTIRLDDFSACPGLGATGGSRVRSSSFGG